MDLQDLIRSIDWAFLENTLERLAAVLLCLTVHETCHGLAAYALGDPTAREHRRLSLNPLRHIDWLGLGMMLVAGFGWARPVPVDPRHFKNPKRGMALTALAGPASNFLLALLAVFLSREVYLHVVAPGPAWAALFEFLLYVLAPLSIGLGLFNLVPIPPLDGAKVLGAFLPDQAYFGLMRYERYGMLLLLALSWLGVTGGFISGAILRVYQFMFELFY
ncbi:MAG: site-2 protease family protein [Oscillibacter sp.]|nr:site-2 protease family protein [Oscillibacter sp.]